MSKLSEALVIDNWREALVVKVWVGDFGVTPVSPEWDGVRIRRDGWPDQRYKRGREMVEHFKDE